MANAPNSIFNFKKQTILNDSVYIQTFKHDVFRAMCDFYHPQVSVAGNSGLTDKM